MTYRPPKEVLAEAERRGWRKALFVTALPSEMAAVRGHLTHLCSTSGGDRSIYECGLFHDSEEEWLIVVAETGPGTHAAQSVVTHAHMALPGFEVQILVGVGGSRKDDTPLGSVVAADHVYMPYGGKVEPEGLSGRPRLFPADPGLVKISRKVCRDECWPDRIRDPLNGKLPEREAYPVEFPPMAVVKPIVSVEAVLNDRDSELEALIAKGFGDAHVVEMEGYGAAFAASEERTPSTMVRGISDMTSRKSSDKDSVLQPAAACHAAAFAFEMLSFWGRSDPRRVTTPSGIALRRTVSARMRDVAEPEATARAPLQGEQPTTVLNLDEEFPLDVPGRLSAIQVHLREITKAVLLKVIDAKHGSLRVWVADPEGVLRNIGVDGLRSALLERNESELLGMVTAAEYSDLEVLWGQLARASRELMQWPKTLAGGQTIERPEMMEVIDRLEGAYTSTTAVVGEPGAGKSALLSTIAHRFVERGWPVLAIKADLLDSNVTREGHLREHLGLDELPSDLLQRMAKFQPVLLVLDQLDALAKYLDRHTSRLSVLLALVRRLSGTNNVHIVMSSRSFEFEHDVRLRAAGAESVPLELPAWSQVLAVLNGYGVHAEEWPEAAKNIIRAPQALAIYLQLDGRGTSEVFTNYRTMLEHLWTERVLSPRDGARRSQLATRMAEDMAEEETLWVPSSRYDDHVEDIEGLQAADVLTKLPGRIGFSHQTIFEHALARSFARERGRLSGYALKRVSSLLLRPKLLTGLSYLRDVEPNIYHDELEAIWKAENLRRHLRILLIDFLGRQTKPTDREARVMAEALKASNQRAEAFRAIIGSRGWFGLFSDIYIAEGMRSSDEDANLQIGILGRAWDFAPHDVERLLQTHWMPDARHDERTWWVLQEARQWTKAMLDIACRIVARTRIDHFRIDFVIGSIGVDQPDLALRLVLAQLNRDLDEAKEESAERAKRTMPALSAEAERYIWLSENQPSAPLKALIERREDSDTLLALAEHAPSTYLEILWPWYEQCLKALREKTEDLPGLPAYALDREADFRFAQDQTMGLSEPTLIAALRIAAERLAEDDPDEWLAWVGKLRGFEVAPVQRLIAHSFAHTPERFAVQALAFMLEDTRRYVLGSTERMTGTSSRLVEAVSGHWSDKDIEHFERAVSDYRPPAPAYLEEAERRQAWLGIVRRVRQSLLRALPRERVSRKTRRLIEQEELAIGDPTIGSRMIGPRWIGPTMSAAEMKRASDEALINAFRKLPDNTDWSHPTQLMLGGNIQLAREFAHIAKEDPQRAERVLLRLPPECGTRATGYALDAMAEGATPEQVLGLLHEAVNGGFDSEEFRTSASRAVGRLVDRDADIPDETVEILTKWIAHPIPEEATESGDTDDALAIGAESDNDGSEVDRDTSERSLLWGSGGITVVPGGDYQVFETLFRVRLAREEFDQADETLCAYLDRCKEAEVWDMLIRYIPRPHPINPARGMGILNRLFRDVPGLVESAYAAFLLANSPSWNGKFADTQLDRWRDSRSHTGRQAYGEIVAVIGLTQPLLRWAQERVEGLIADRTMEEARAGAALSAAHLWNDSATRPGACDLLTRLLAGGGRGVWKGASEVFRRVDKLTPDPATVAILEVFARSDIDHEAIGWHTERLIKSLGTLLPHEGELVGRVAKNLVAAAKKKLANDATRPWYSGAELVDLAVTLHRSTPETRETGTELIEDLTEIDALAVRRTLDQLDNRFPMTPAMPRRRLARRHRSERCRRRNQQPN